MASHHLTNLFLTSRTGGAYFMILQLVLLLQAALTFEKAYGNSMVSGTVFCDQCKDGQRSLFDYPLSGMKVVVACSDSNGQVTMSREATTNWIGSYTISFQGNPDLTAGCYAQIINSGTNQAVSPSNSCAAAAGPAKGLKLMFNMFDTAVYAVDSLLSQPAQPMPFCPRSATPVPPPPLQPAPQPPPCPSPVVRLPPPPVLLPPPSPIPVVHLPPPLVQLPPPSPIPVVRLPPPPVQLPLIPPFFQPSACPSQTWMMAEYKCYWKVVGPDTKVAVAFGLIAAQRYGTEMTLMEGLQGRGNLYGTLLREGTTALLNSYNSFEFSYSTPAVLGYMNWALMSSPQHTLQMALQFKRANSGSARVPCNFTPCKY